MIGWWYLIEVFRLFGTISINKAKAIADLNAVNAAGAGLGTKLGKVFKTIGKVALVAFAAIAAAGALIFVKAIKTAADFEFAMAKVSAVTGATAEEFAALTEKAEELGLSTAQTMTDIAAGMEALGRAGFDAGEIIDAMGGVVALAEAETIGLARAAEITANMIRQFGLEAADADRVVNLLSAAASSSNTTVESLGESMKFFGPIAHAMGMSLEEAVAAVGKLGDAGLKGGIATRALQTSLQGLAKPTDEAVELMDELGISMFDANGEFVGMEGALEQLEIGFDGLTQQQKLAAMATIFGTGAVKQFSNLLGVGSEELERYTEEITGTTKAFDKQAEMIATLKGQWTIWKGSLELLFQTLGVTVLPMLENLLRDHIIPITNALRNWIKEMGGLKGVIGHVMVAIGHYILAAADWIESNEFVRVAVEGVWSVLKDLWSFVKNVFTGDWSAAWQSIKSVAVTVLETITSLVVTAWEALPIPDGIKSGISTALQAIGDGIKAAFLWLLDHKEVIIGAFAGVAVAMAGIKIAALVSGFASMLNPVGLIIAAFAALAAGIAYVVVQWDELPIPDSVKNKILSTVTAIKDGAVAGFVWIKDKAVEAWAGIKESFDEHGAGLIEAWDSLKTAASNLWGAINDAFTSIMGVFGETGEEAISFSDVVKGIFDILLIAATTLIDGWSDLFDFWASLLRGDWSQAWTDFKTFLSGIWDGIVAILDVVGLSDKISEAWDYIKQDAITKWTAIGDFFDKIWDSITGAFQSAIDWVRSIIPGFIQRWLGWGEESADSYAEGIESGKAGVEKAAENVAGAAVKAIAMTVDEAKEAGEELVSAFAGALTDGESDAEDAGESLGSFGGDGIINGLEGKFGALETAGAEAIGAVFTGIEDEGDMHSPSKVAEGYGEDIDQGLIDGMRSKGAELIAAGQELIDSTMVPLEEAPVDAAIAGEATGEAYGDGVEGGITDANADIQTAVDSVTETLKTGAEDMAEKLVELQDALDDTVVGSYAYGEALQDLVSFHENLVKVAEFLEDQNIEVDASLTALIASTIKYAEEQEALEKATKEAEDALEDQKSAFKDLAKEIIGVVRGAIEDVIDGFKRMTEAAEDHEEALEDIADRYSDNVVDDLLDRTRKEEDALTDHNRDMEDITEKYNRDLADLRIEDFDDADDYFAKRAKIEADYQQDIADEREDYARKLGDIDTDHTRQVEDNVADRDQALADEEAAYKENKVTILDIVKDTMEGIATTILNSGIDKAVDWAVEQLARIVFGSAEATTAATTAAATITPTVGATADAAATTLATTGGSLAGLGTLLWNLAGIAVPIFIGTSDKVANWVANVNKWITETLLGQQYGGGITKTDQYGNKFKKDDSGNWVPFAKGALFTKPTLLPPHMVAEGGVSEAYLPLSPRIFGNIGQGIVDALSVPTATPALAGAGAGGGSIQVDMRGLYDGATINVRDDQDISRIAEETHSLWRSRMRGIGRNV